MRFFFKALVLINYLLLNSCNSRVDCNLDLEYKDGLTYLDGKLFSGNCDSFYETGAMMNQQTYLNGMDHGTWYFYFKNEKIETIANFLNNKKHGEWKYFYDNGETIRQISHYEFGKRDSIWTKYSFSGEVEWQKKY